eukprot:scaffold3065_cov141-Isochrysis_galbana.AAC.3
MQIIVNCQLGTGKRALFLWRKKRAQAPLLALSDPKDKARVLCSRQTRTHPWSRAGINNT